MLDGAQTRRECCAHDTGGGVRKTVLLSRASIDVQWCSQWLACRHPDEVIHSNTLFTCRSICLCTSLFLRCLLCTVSDHIQQHHLLCSWAKDLSLFVKFAAAKA